MLIIAQRPLLAKKIANTLCKSKIIDLEGIYKTCPIFAFESKFKDFIANVKVTSADESLYTINFSEELDLLSINPIDLFKEKTLKQPISKLLCKHLQQAARKADVVVLWTDMSIEGENICLDIIDNVKKYLPENKHEDYVFRAKYRSLAVEEITSSFENLIHKPNEYESMSIDALKTIDLKIEQAFTMFLTKKLIELYPSLEKLSTKLTYDTCLMAALGLVVDRYLRVSSQPQVQKFYSISVFIKESRTGF